MVAHHHSCSQAAASDATVGPASDLRAEGATAAGFCGSGKDMRGSSLRALRRLVQSEPELTALSGRLLASSLAAQPSAVAIGALARNEPALQRLAQRLAGTLAASAASGGGRGLGAGLPARVRQSERLQVRCSSGFQSMWTTGTAATTL